MGIDPDKFDQQLTTDPVKQKIEQYAKIFEGKKVNSHFFLTFRLRS